mmetsp:Transcript_24846/g.35051  ORF Transcript_24846/g.35051 Transcript_24846/m.35051 type:complete len:234 (-) Transcript_24846:952-1653(-)
MVVVDGTGRTANVNNNIMGSLEQLNRVQALIEVERSLTKALEKSASLLDSSTKSSNIINYDPDAPVTRPTPKNIKEVELVWAVARNLASRTSAPAGWNPACPPVGFATPNPRPDQLRGGALGTLQLERAQKANTAEQNKKRQRLEEEARKKKEESESRAKRAREGSLDPKSRELSGKGHQIGLDRTNSDIVRSANDQQRKRPSVQPVVEASMKLSDSSSSEEEEDDDDDDESD